MGEMDQDIKIAEGKARQHFFIPIDESAMFAGLDKAIARSLPAFTPIAKAFRHNLSAVISTVSVPFHLVAAHVQGLRFQQIHTAEAIRARIDMKDAATKVLYEKALPIARERFSEESKEPETIRKFSDQILLELKQNLEREDLARAASELLRQGAVAVWGSLEVLAQDIFVALLNSNPTTAVELLTHERTKQLFQLKAIPLETLSTYDFDLSGSFGDILIRYRNVDTIPVMKAVFGVLLWKSEDLRTTLDNKDLWILNQRRHLIVHRRGIVDAEYLSKTGEAFALGSELVISPDDLERYLSLTSEAGLQLINAACIHQASPGGQSI
jgi:hypothetical protein